MHICTILCNLNDTAVVSLPAAGFQRISPKSNPDGYRKLRLVSWGIELGQPL